MKILVASFCLLLSPAILAFNEQANLNPMQGANASLELSLDHPKETVYFAALDKNNQLIVSSFIEEGNVVKTLIWNNEGKIIETIPSRMQVQRAVFSFDSSIVALCYDNYVNFWGGFEECCFYYIDKNKPENNKKIRSVRNVKNVFFLNSTNQLVFLERSSDDENFDLKRLVIHEGNVVLEETIDQFINPLWVGETSYPAEDKIFVIEREMPDNNLIKIDIFYDHKYRVDKRLNIKCHAIAFFRTDAFSPNDDFCLIIQEDQGHVLFSKCGDAHHAIHLDYPDIDDVEFNQGDIFILKEGEINIYSNGKLNRTLEDLSRERHLKRLVNQMSLNSDGGIIAVILGDGGDNSAVEIWDRKSGKVLTELVDPKISTENVKRAHSDEIYDIEFDESGKRLMSVSSKTVKIWYINSCDQKTLRQSLKIDPLGLAPRFPSVGNKRKYFPSEIPLSKNKRIIN